MANEAIDHGVEVPGNKDAEDRSKCIFRDARSVAEEAAVVEWKYNTDMTQNSNGRRIEN